MLSSFYLPGFQGIYTLNLCMHALCPVGAKHPTQRSFISFTVLRKLGDLYNANSLLVEVSEERICAVVDPRITYL
jgi:hypothetical protein